LYYSNNESTIANADKYKYSKLWWGDENDENIGKTCELLGADILVA